MHYHEHGMSLHNEIRYHKNAIVMVIDLLEWDLF